MYVLSWLFSHFCAVRSAVSCPSNYALDLVSQITTGIAYWNLHTLTSSKCHAVSDELRKVDTDMVAGQEKHIASYIDSWIVIGRIGHNEVREHQPSHAILVLHLHMTGTVYIIVFVHTCVIYIRIFDLGFQQFYDVTIQQLVKCLPWASSWEQGKISSLVAANLLSASQSRPLHSCAAETWWNHLKTPESDVYQTWKPHWSSKPILRAFCKL